MKVIHDESEVPCVASRYSSYSFMPVHVFWTCFIDMHVVLNLFCYISIHFTLIVSQIRYITWKFAWTLIIMLFI